MLQFMRRQAEIAIESAEVIIMVTDVKVGVKTTGVKLELVQPSDKSCGLYEWSVK